MYDFVKAVQVFNEMIKSLFEYLTKKTEKQADSEVLNDKKKLKKASDVAEELINNTDAFFSWTAKFLDWELMSFKQKRQFAHYFKKHKKLKKIFEKVD